MKVQVRGQDSLEACPAMYSNFVSISRVGADVQLEFLFLDLNFLAQLTLQMNALPTEIERQEFLAKQVITGKTVSKIVMPGFVFFQLREHLDQIFNALGEILMKQEPNVERSRSGTG